MTKCDYCGQPTNRYWSHQITKSMILLSCDDCFKRMQRSKDGACCRMREEMGI